MKKLISMAMLIAAVVVSSCSKQEVEPAADTVQVNFTAQAPQTRAAVTDLTRFVVEVYEGATATSDPVQHIEQDDANFTLTLKKNTAYTFLVWADYGRPYDNTSVISYDASDLKAVKKVQYEERGTLAFYGALTNQMVTTTSGNFSIELTHAVARIILENTRAFVSENNWVLLEFPARYSFNVADGTTSFPGFPYTRTFSGIGSGTGVIATDYVFASADGMTMNITRNFNGEGLAEITNVPLKANYTTRIKGEFSNFYNSTFTVSSEVEEMGENNQEF